MNFNETIAKLNQTTTKLVNDALTDNRQIKEIDIFEILGDFIHSIRSNVGNDPEATIENVEFLNNLHIYLSNASRSVKEKADILYDRI